MYEQDGYGVWVSARSVSNFVQVNGGEESERVQERGAFI